MDTQHLELLLKKSFHYLSFRSRTEQEVKNYLQKKIKKYNFQPSIVQQTIEYLKERNYINDKNFVEEYINSRLRSKPRSLYLIKLELSQKGISDKDVEAYFLTNTINEQPVAENLLSRKFHTWERLPYLKKKKKAYDFLKSKGFSFDIIREVFENVDKGQQ